MMDKVTLKRIELVHPNLRDEALFIYTQICEVLEGKAICRFTHTLRTYKEQNDLYALGRTKKGRKVTWAKGGYSYHNFGMAIDICLIIDGKEASWDTVKDFDNDGVADWMEVVGIFKMNGWEWGGDWSVGKKDMPHFQKTLGNSTAQLRSKEFNGAYPIL